MPRTIEINNGMKNSNTLVAPTRSEIRTSFSVEFNSIAAPIKGFLRSHTLSLTFTLVTLLGLFRILGVVLPCWIVISMAIFACIGCVRGCLYILSEAELFEQKRLKEGKA